MRRAVRRLAPIVDVLVRIQRLLWRPYAFRDVLQVDAHTRPRAKAAAHRVNQNIRRLKMRRSLGMT